MLHHILVNATEQNKYVRMYELRHLSFIPEMQEVQFDVWSGLHGYLRAFVYVRVCTRARICVSVCVCALFITSKLHSIQRLNAIAHSSLYIKTDDISL